MKIGVLGGTFDPPHKGHIAIAEAAMQQLGLDEVIFVPAGKNPLKDRKSSPQRQRLEMVKLAIEGHAGFSVTDIEVARGGPSYTVETLMELQHIRPGEYWLILGSDALVDLERWRDYKKLLRLARLAGVVRPPHTRELVEGKLTEEVREKVDFVEVSPIECSSTEIRRLFEDGRIVTGLVIEPVRRYAAENRLYGRDR